MGVLDVNWLAVVLAAVSGFVVGGIWYGPVMGKKWMGAVGLTEEDIQNGAPAITYGGAFVLSLIASWVLAHMLSYFPGISVVSTVIISVGVAAGFIIPAMGTNYLFSQRSKSLFAIDAGYWLLFYTAMGLVHAYL